jgi:hypothetical protein
MAGGYLSVAGVLSGMGGRVIVHGGLHDICMTSSSQWPVMSVTSWRVSLKAVDEVGKGVISVLTSSVDEIDIESTVEVADSVSEVEEEASPSSVVEVDFESPEIVLTTVVTTFVLVWLPDAPEVLIEVIVLTNVVTTSLLDWLLCVPGTVIVEVLFDWALDLKVVEVVWFPPLLLLADAVTPVVKLLWLIAVLMLVVVELISGVWEIEIIVVDEIRLDVFWAEVEMVTCVSDVGGEDDDVERDTTGVFLLVLCVSATLAERVALLEVDDATVWLDPPVVRDDPEITVEDDIE